MKETLRIQNIGIAIYHQSNGLNTQIGGHCGYLQRISRKELVPL